MTAVGRFCRFEESRAAQSESIDIGVLHHRSLLVFTREREQSHDVHGVYMLFSYGGREWALVPPQGRWGGCWWTNQTPRFLKGKGYFSICPVLEVWGAGYDDAVHGWRIDLL